MASYSHTINMIKMIMILMVLSMEFSNAQLSSDHYSTTCPKALSTIRNGVTKAVFKEHRMGASLLRLHFHDCFVNGCDASVLLDDTPNMKGEKTAGPNDKSLRGFEVIDTIKSQVEALCPGVVSCADILAVAARDSVVAVGGPTWTVELGRRDSTTASYKAANSGNLPSPLMDVNQLISSFSDKGLTPKELVALSGAHSIGQARCLMFRDRVHKNATNIDTSFATSLKSNCPISGSDDDLSPLDTSSPVLFDNAYFRNLVDKKGLLHSDQQLFSGGSTDDQVTAYANNFFSFNIDFGNAMVKMGNMSPLTGSNGQIRTNCRKVN